MHAWEASRGARLIGPLGLSAVVMCSVCGLSAVGLGEGMHPMAGVLSSVLHIWGTGPIALMYLLGAFGIGRLAMMWTLRASRHRHWIQAACGLGLMLWISHMLGGLGLISGPGGWPRVVAWGSVAFGLMLLLDQIIRGGGSLRPEKWPVMTRTAALWGVAIGLVLVAACNPPGWLWRSEHGAYDALSYHLQLPKEWAAGARLWPSHDNVYSFLPSYMEAAYQHVGMMMLGSSADPIERMLGGEGSWVIACQLLHAGVMILAGLLAGRAAAAMMERIGVEEHVRVPIASASGLLVVATPWMTVVGSLAYNEAPMIALMAGGVLVAVDVSVGVVGRGVIAGLLVGAATSAKPTAALFVEPVVAIFLLGNMKPLAWWKTLLGGGIAGVVMVGPWLVRNVIDSGNPVFPFAYKLLGTGHWTLEQCQRYARNHVSRAGLGDRLVRIFSEDRGVMHAQWGMMVGVLIVGLLIGVLARSTRRWTVLTGIGLVVQLTAWLQYTHLQSRFLLPIVVPGALVLALGATGGRELLARGGARMRAAPAVLACVVGVVTSAWGVLLFMSEGGGEPNRLLVGGVGGMTGLTFEETLERMQEKERVEFLETQTSPVWYANLALKWEGVGNDLYLLGDAAPLYYLGALGGVKADDRVHVVYQTTWDESLLGAAMSSGGDDPGGWSSYLMGRGIRYMLVNFDELARLIDKDHYFDPLVTTERITRWLNDPRNRLREIRRWNASGNGPPSHVLYELGGGSPQPSGRPTGGGRP